MSALPLTELDQLKRQNALLLKRLLVISRERDALKLQIAALEQSTGWTPAADAGAR
jgi:hypothetical protein